MLLSRLGMASKPKRQHKSVGGSALAALASLSAKVVAPCIFAKAIRTARNAKGITNQRVFVITASSHSISVHGDMRLPLRLGHIIHRCRGLGKSAGDSMGKALRPPPSCGIMGPSDHHTASLLCGSPGAQHRSLGQRDAQKESHHYDGSRFG